MKFVSSQTSQQLPQQQHHQAQNHFPSLSQNPPPNASVMNSMNVNNAITMNGPSNMMSNTNHVPPGMSSFSGASSSPHLSSETGLSDGAMMSSAAVASTDGSNDTASSSGVYGAVGGASSSSALASHLGDPNAVVLTKRRLQDLVKEIDPMEVLDDDVEDVLLQIADDFIENVVTSGCQMAKHRKSSTLEVKDVQLHLQRNWNMWIPGFGSEELRPHKKAPVTDAHKQRLALIKKTLKKF